MPSLKIRFDQLDTGEPKQVGIILNEHEVVDVTSLRLQLSWPVIQNVPVAGFVYPRMRVVLQKTQAMGILPGDDEYINAVDLLANNLFVRPVVNEVFAQMQTYNHVSMPGGELINEQFYAAFVQSGNLPTSFILECTLFYSVKKLTELEYVKLALR